MDPLSQHAGSFLTNEAQTVYGHKSKILACDQPGIHQDPQDPLCKTTFQPSGSQCVLVLGILSPQMQESGFPFVELHVIS